MRAGEHSAAAAIAAALALAAAPGAADWLVLADGSRVETAGPWEVRGDLVVFTLTNGTLSSVRAAQVDLPASEAATGTKRPQPEARRPPLESPPASPAPEAPEGLDEPDAPSGSPPASPAPEAPEGLDQPDPPSEVGPAAAAEGDATAAESAPAPVAAAAARSGGDPRLTVTGWSAATPDDYDGTVVTGRLRNVGGQLLVQAAVEALVYDASGAPLARTPASLPAGPIAPDREVAFEARFPGVRGVTTARFEVRAVAFLEDEPPPSWPQSP